MWGVNTIGGATLPKEAHTQVPEAPPGLSAHRAAVELLLLGVPLVVPVLGVPRAVRLPDPALPLRLRPGANELSEFWNIWRSK